MAEAPACSSICFSDFTIFPLGTCGIDDIACLCAYQPFAQEVVNCLANSCVSRDEFEQAVSFSEAFCESVVSSLSYLLQLIF